MKKTFLAFMILMLIMCLVGCNEESKETELENLKYNTKQEIKEYVTLLNENNYNEEEWYHILEIVNESNILIDEYDDIISITTYKKNILAEIDLVTPSIITEEWIEKHFNLDEEKQIWNGNIDEEFTDDLIIIVLKETYTYPTLNLNFFELENATKMEYAGGVTPPKYFFKSEYQHLLNNFRQIIYIYLEQSGKEKVIESIRKLEKLEFVKSVSPNYILQGV